METSKIYLGNLEASDKFGDEILEGILNITDLEKVLEEWAYAAKKSGDKILRVKVVKRKTTNAFDQTHYVELDQFRYDSKKESTEEAEVTS